MQNLDCQLADSDKSEEAELDFETAASLLSTWRKVAQRMKQLPKAATYRNADIDDVRLPALVKCFQISLTLMHSLIQYTRSV